MNTPFNIPFIIGSEINAISETIGSRRMCGGGTFGKLCEKLLEKILPDSHVLMTTSCTDALEICADLINIKPGDEIIAPSFTFVSSVNPFVMRGARVRFVDIDYPSLNVSAKTIEAAISPATRAVIAVNYGGGSANLEEIRIICDKYNIFLIEDAAQSLLASYNDKPLGTFGHLSCLSFHETKNIQCGEGGALVINQEHFLERAEVIREKGTNRSQFFRGEVDKYSWVDLGSSHIPSELTSAFLSEQLKYAKEITERRILIWNEYKKICDYNSMEYLKFENGVKHNAHIFGVFAPSLDVRTEGINRLKKLGIHATFHYVPLHSSLMGKRNGKFIGEDINTTLLSEKLIRLPLYPDLDVDVIKRSIDELSLIINQK